VNKRISSLVTYLLPGERERCAYYISKSLGNMSHAVDQSKKGKDLEEHKGNG
jgi:hypothetical protein